MKNYTKKGRVCAQEEGSLSSILHTFTDKEKELPVPYQTGDSCFVLAMEKFSEVITDVSVLEMEYMTDIDNIIEEIQTWIKQELQEKTKTFKKRFDTAKSEYEKGLAKVASLQQQKVIPITKLYLAEIELSKLKKEYEESTYVLENHCEDIQQRVNFFIVEQLIRWFNSHKKLIGYSYGYLDDIKDYLKDLKLWCKEEEDLFLSHSQNRKEKREIIHTELEEKYVLDFIQTFSNFDLIQSISQAISQDIPANQIFSLFANMFRGYQLEVPQALAQYVQESSNENGESSLRRIQTIIRDNFDVIGTKLMEEGKKDSLVLLGQVLSSLEKPQTNTK
jgi:hypothetical protein